MSDRLFERAVLAWLEDGSDKTPRPAIDAVLLAIKTTPQERGLRLPRRYSLMPTYLRAGAAIAVVAIVAVGVFAWNSRGLGIGAGPSSVPASIQPSAAPTLALIANVSSTIHGYDARIPDGWRIAMGTAVGSPTDLAPGEQQSAAIFWDHFTPPAPGVTGTGIYATGAVLPAGMSEDEWIAAYQAPQVADNGRQCIPERSRWSTVTVDGHVGGIYVGCGFVESTLFVDGRVYDFYYFNEGATAALPTTGRALLESFLATVRLHPELVAAPSSPAP